MHVTLFSNQLIFGSPDLLTTQESGLGWAALVQLSSVSWDGSAPLSWPMNWWVNHMEWFYTYTQHAHTHTCTRISLRTTTVADVEHKCLIKWSMHKLGFTFGPWVSCPVLGSLVCWFNKHKMCQQCKIILSPSGANKDQQPTREMTAKPTITIGYKV